MGTIISICEKTTVDSNMIKYYFLQMAEIAEWCLSEDPINRPEIRDILPMLSNIMTSSVEWEASLGGNSPVFSGIYNGR